MPKTGMADENDDSAVPVQTMNRYGGTESFTIKRLENLIVQTAHINDCDREESEAPFIPIQRTYNDVITHRDSPARCLLSQQGP